MYSLWVQSNQFRDPPVLGFYFLISSKVCGEEIFVIAVKYFMEDFLFDGKTQHFKSMDGHPLSLYRPRIREI